jgi:hypothetical protein
MGNDKDIILGASDIYLLSAGPLGVSQKKKK